MFSKLDYPKTSTARLLPLVTSIGMVKMVRCPFSNKKSNQNYPRQKEEIDKTVVQLRINLSERAVWPLPLASGRLSLSLWNIMLDRSVTICLRPWVFTQCNII